MQELEEFPSLELLGTPHVCWKCLCEEPNISCRNFLKCQYQKRQKANVVIHEYPDKKEVLIFKDAFYQRASVELNTNIDRTRKFFYDENGVLNPVDSNATNSIFDLLVRLEDSRKRGLQNFYGYVLSNDWDYFLTLTVKSGINFDKFNDSDIEYIWKLFRQKMQYRFRDIKIICIREYHKKGGLHFHCLLGNCKLNPYLSIAINSKKQIKKNGVLVNNPDYLCPLFTKFGDQIYNLSPKVYDFGFTEIVIINDKNNFKLANYMSKYMVKDNAQVKYNKKLFFRTHNLNFGNTQCSFLTEQEKVDLLNELTLLNTISYQEKEKLTSIWIKKEEEN